MWFYIYGMVLKSRREKNKIKTSVHEPCGVMFVSTLVCIFNHIHFSRQCLIVVMAPEKNIENYSVHIDTQIRPRHALLHH